MQGYADQEYSAGGLYKEYMQARDLKYAMFRERIRKIHDHVDGGRLLDVGCSCGYFIDVALEESFDAYGIEFSPFAIEAASEATRPRIFHGDVNLLQSTPHSSYDIVTAFDIIEHTSDPLQFLTRLRGVLKKGGLLVITTPDTGHFLRSVMRKRWPMLQPFQHTILFSGESLRLALEMSGYRDIELMPARKTVTLDYLMQQLKSLNPRTVRMYNRVSRALPGRVRHWPVSLNIGEIMAIAWSKN